VCCGLALVVTACASMSGSKQSGPFVAPPKPVSVAQAPVGEPEPGPPAAPAAPLAPVAPVAPPRAAGVAQGRQLTVPGGPLGIRIRITDERGTRIVTLPLDEYVLGCVRAELSPETLKSQALGRTLQVQAIVSRTYAIANLGRHAAEGFDLCDSTHCQLYRAKLASEHDQDPAARAVADTRGQIVTYEGRPIQAVFHSNCGGHTTAAEHVWKGPAVPYLRPVPDWFCSRAGTAKWTFSASEAEIRAALNAAPQTATGRRLERIDITGRDSAGRATLVTLAGEQNPLVRAEEFRAVMRKAFGPRSIQSTWFSVARQGETFRFSGVGYGHGVGLCQAGAALRAQAGQTAADILTHYFPGTRLETVPSLEALLSHPASTRAAR
jgi:stage II sporulation protein D